MRSAELPLSFPASQDFANGALDFHTRLPSVVTSRQQAVVIGLPMPNVRDHRQPHGLFIQTLRRSRPAHASAVFPARVLGYCGFSSLGAGREEFSDSLREPLHVLPIQLLSPDGLALSAPLSDLAVG